MEGLGHLLVLPNAEAPVQPPYQESSASKGNTAGAVWLCIQTLMSFCITVTNYTRKPFQWAPHAKIDLTQWPTSLLLILLLNMLLLNLQPQTLCSSHVRKKSLELSWTCFLFFILMYKIIALDNLSVKLNFNTQQEVHLSGKHLEEQRGGVTGLSGLASAMEDPQHINPGRSQPENQAGIIHTVNFLHITPKHYVS